LAAILGGDADSFQPVTSHGTGFIYAKDGDDYLIVTNYHVANVLPGEYDAYANERVTLVENGNDTYTPDDVVLEKIAGDPLADIQILRLKKADADTFNKSMTDFNAHAEDKRRAKPILDVYTGPIGSHRAARHGDTVAMFGIPYSEYPAFVDGKVSNPHYEDRYNRHGWRHWDIALDVSTNPGNSGSAVFLVTPEHGYEWIGLLHMGFSNAEGMNHAIDITDFHDMLTTRRAPKRELMDQSRYDTLATEIPKRKETYDVLGQRVHAKPNDKGISINIAAEHPPNGKPGFIDLVDKADTGYGTLDSIVVITGTGIKQYPTKDFPANVRDAADRLYETTGRALLDTWELKQLEAIQTPTLHQHEQTLRAKEDLELANMDDAYLKFRQAFDVYRANTDRKSGDKPPVIKTPPTKPDDHNSPR